jgi:hypothetical protein
MNVVSSLASSQTPKALLPILVGGLVAGTLDLTSAFITFGWGVPRAIASGLLGAKALQGGLGTWTNLIVLPLSAIPFNTHTFTLGGLTQGLLVHMLIIGLPISFSVWKFST